jgi:hypothetical protein
MPIVDRFKPAAPRIQDRFSGVSSAVPPFINPDQPIGHSGAMLTPSGGLLDNATADRLQRDNPAMLQELMGRDYSPEHAARTQSLGSIIDARTGLAAAGLAQGVKQMGLRAGEVVGAVDPGTADAYTQRITADRSTYDPMTKERPYASAAGDLFGTALITAPVGLGPAAWSWRGFNTAAASNAALAGADFTPEDQSRLANTAAGGALGAIGHGVAHVLGKTVNASREAVGNTLAAASERLKRPPGNTINALRARVRDLKEQEIIDRARESGIPLTVGDVTQSPIALGMDAALERLAVMGTAGLRRKQAEKMTEMVKDQRNRWWSYVQGPDDPPLDSAAMAVKESMWREKVRRQAIAGQKYKAVADAAGDAPLLTRNLSQTARRMLDLETQNIPNVEMQNSTLMGMLGRYTRDTGLTFEGAQSLRSRLKSDIRAAKHNKVIGSDEVRIANRLVDALEGDIKAFGAEQGGRVQTLLRDADTYYAREVVPLNDTMTARMMNDADFDSKFDTWMRTPSRMRRVYQTTDEKGKAAMRVAFLDRAVDMATISAEGRQFISPTRFVATVDNMQKAVGRIFIGQHGKELEGMTRFIRHLEGVDRAMGTTSRQSAQMTQTAMSTAAGGAAGAMAGSANPIKPGAIAKMAANVGLLKLALSSKAGVRLLTAAADLKGDRQTGMSYLWDSMRGLAERQQLILDRQLSPSEDE